MPQRRVFYKSNQIMTTTSFLFLDRDGVINTRIPDEYVRTVEQFIFEPGALQALALLRPYFERMVVVTNQAGIGKGLMTEADLAKIHDYLQTEATAVGCPLDAIYFCPNVSADQASCRKPDIGMGQWAQRDFPDIQFESAWMVGDSASDIEFGRRLGMKTALVTGKIGEEHEPVLADISVGSLWAFAEWIKNH